MNPIPSTTIQHCTLCNMTHEEAKKIGDMAIIFLGIEYTLRGGSAIVYPKTMHELFGDNGKSGSYSDLQYRQARSRYLSKSAVSNLKQLIDRLEAIGIRVGIVIACSWATDGTTKQVCEDMFKYQESFSGHIIGKTPSKCSWDPELKSLQKEMKTSYSSIAKAKYGYDINDHCQRIKFWIDEHQLRKNFVILRECHSGEEFGNRLINSDLELSKSDVDNAFNVLSECEITLIQQTKNQVNEGQLQKINDKKYPQKISRFHEKNTSKFRFEPDWLNPIQLRMVISGGVCYGVFLDIARQFLIKHKPIQEVLRKFTPRGARLKSAIYQSIYEKTVT